MRIKLLTHALAIIGIAAFAFAAIGSASRPNTESPERMALAAYFRGAKAYREGNYDLAIAEYTEAIRLVPSYADAYHSRGQAYEKKGDYDRASQDYKTVLIINPYSSRQDLERIQQTQEQTRLTQEQAQAAIKYTGAGGRGIRLGILAPEGQNLSAQLAYLPAMVQGVLVSIISKYSGISVLDRISLDKVIAETLDPTYEDNLDIVRLGHVAQVGHMLTGKIIRTSSGYTLQLNITDTTPEAKTAAAYSGTCTVAQLDDHTAVQKAARELLVELGVELKDTAVTELAAAPPTESVAAQTALAQGITAQKQGNDVVALNYYTQATMLDPALKEAATRFSTLAVNIQGINLTQKLNYLRAFAQTGSTHLFELPTDESIPAQTLSFSGKRNITVILRGIGANRTLNNGFTVDSGVTLVLDNNITLRGTGVIVNAGGTLVMNSGSAVTGNRGHGVSVAGTFTMNGGTISGNTASNGGGVSVSGTFTMNGGTISGNTAFSSLDDGGGGGVFVNSGTFTMRGGTITGNSASYDNGGGVSVNGGTFTMSGGTISSNTAYISRGGGVSVNGGTFTMSNGTISGNRSSGVSVIGTFTMRDGIISGNTSRNGGGVYVSNRGTFTMSGGTISGNTASENGGGVWVASNRTFTKTGGTIYGYSANDPVNSNAVKDDSGAVQHYQGHAVWAGVTTSLLKIKESTAGPGNNLSYDGSKSPPTASGAWDN